MLRLRGCLWGLGLVIVALVEGRGAELPRVPEGFTIERVTGAEQVQHPMMACFDDQGRLYVCESAGTNRKASELIADPQDSIRVLEDTDGDGVFDKSWTFADKLVFPQGCLWYRGAVYTCSSPYLWKLADTDGDGVCDQRTVLVKSFGFSGNAADIHGPFLSPDGRLYWCDGRHGHEIRDLGDGDLGGEDNVRDIPPKPEPGLPNPEGELLTRGKAARIFSCRPDGSDLRVLCGGGMDNPVEVDFWETGECLGTVNLFYGRPRGDCLVHWAPGGVYPRDDMPDCIAEFKGTGGLLGPVTNYGHVAVSGMCRYRSQVFGDLTATGDNAAKTTPPPAGASSLADRAAFFVTQFNTHRVVKTIVERQGASFRAVETSDFLVSADPDFHPTDVLEDADGSLLVIDTGGWFRIGCPTSQIAKPEIGGAIYRIRKTGSAPVDDPWGRKLAAAGTQLDMPTLVRALGDARPAVRERAIELAAQRLGAGEEPAIETCRAVNDRGTEPERIGFLAAAARAGRSLLTWRSIQSDPSGLVRLAALLSRPELDPTQPDASLDHIVEAIVGRVASTEPAEARGAIECLTELTAVAPAAVEPQQVVPKLLERLRQADVDRNLEHAAIVALTRSGARNEVARGLRDEQARVQRAALIALDQMDTGGLSRDEVLPLLATGDAALRETVLDVISRRQGWGAETVPLLKTWLSGPLDDARASMARRFIAAQAGDPGLQQLVVELLSEEHLAASSRDTLLEALAAADVASWPASWDAPLMSLLASAEPETQLAVLQLIGSRGLRQFDATLTRLMEDRAQPAAVRIEALAAVAPRLQEVPQDSWTYFSGLLHDESQPLLLRLKLAAAYAAAPLDDQQFCQIAGDMARLGPTLAAAVLPAFERCTWDDAQRRLVVVLTKMEELPTVSGSQLRSLLAKFTPEVQAEAAPLLERLHLREASALQRLERYLPWAEGGDASRGRYVFFGQTAACSKCHRVGNEGAQIGPDLTRIATIRQPRDLVESIVLPSASFARDFHPYTAVTREGRVVSGLISRQTATAVVFRLTDLSEVRLNRDEIELLREGETSIMPQGLETKLNEQDFRDLLAYLQSLK